MKESQPVALVTGGSGGVGEAISRRLADIGYRVVVHYNTRSDKATALAKSLPNHAIAIQSDLLSEGGPAALIGQIERDFGRLDVLVNNAGWTQVIAADDLAALSPQLCNHIMTLKVNAPIQLIQAAKDMLQQANPGHILNITSVAGIAAKGSNIIYAAANAALSTLTKSLARSLAPSIRVNAIAPGFMNTGFAWPIDGNAESHVQKQGYIDRVITPEDVADVAVFLLSSGHAITGEEIAVDGGIGRLGVKKNI